MTEPTNCLNLEELDDKRNKDWHKCWNPNGKFAGYEEKIKCNNDTISLLNKRLVVFHT